MSPRTTRLLVAVSITTALLATACADDPAADPAAAAPAETDSSDDPASTSGVRVVAPEVAADLLSASVAENPDTESPVVVLDVRTPEEYAEGHLEGAVLIDAQAPDFADRLAELPRDGRYVIYCRSGNRSAQARAIMEELGFTDVADVDGGIVAWSAAGLPVVTG